MARTYGLQCPASTGQADVRFSSARQTATSRYCGDYHRKRRSDDASSALDRHNPGEFGGRRGDRLCALYVLSERVLRRTYDVPAVAVTIPLTVAVRLG